jgi:hypothetical protein
MYIHFPYPSGSGSPGQKIKAFHLFLTNDLSYFQLIAPDSSVFSYLNTLNSGVTAQEVANRTSSTGFSSSIS